jgi:hypothetical protein
VGSRPDEVNEFFFSIYQILPAAMGTGVHSASNRNEHQKQKIFLGSRELITYLPSVSQLSRQCGILNISQPYRPPRPVTGIALLLLAYKTTPGHSPDCSLTHRHLSKPFHLPLVSG